MGLVAEDIRMKELLKLYEMRKYEIGKKLEEFKSKSDSSDEELFKEFVFCILTPQSKAVTSWNAVQALERNGLIFKGNENQIRPFLQAVRFGDTKSKRIVKNREFLMENGKLKIKDNVSNKDPIELREWLVENIIGYGMKEASHFIRNIGFSKNQLAILDVHILKNLKEFGIIDDIPKSLTRKRYLEIEEKMKGFANRLGITLDELDLLLWSKEAGIVFK